MRRRWLCWTLVLTSAFCLAPWQTISSAWQGCTWMKKVHSWPRMEESRHRLCVTQLNVLWWLKTTSLLHQFRRHLWAWVDSWYRNWCATTSAWCSVHDSSLLSKELTGSLRHDQPCAANARWTTRWTSWDKEQRWKRCPHCSDGDVAFSAATRNRSWSTRTGTP